MDSDDGRLLVAIAICTALAFPTILWAVETNVWPELMADDEALSLTLVYMAIF